MVAATDPFAVWLAQARIPEQRLSPDQHGVLRAAFHFRQVQGHDASSTRLLTHFLLHCGSGLKVAQLARLAGVSRPTASRQQGLSSKETVQQAHHRLEGRPHGKLLPRYAGPIIEFLLGHPKATRAEVLDFIDQTFGVRVSRIALYKFLKKFGIDRRAATASPAATAAPTSPHGVASPPPPTATRATPAAPLAPPAPAATLPVGTLATTLPLGTLTAMPAPAAMLPLGTLAPTPAPPFSSATRSTRAPF